MRIICLILRLICTAIFVIVGFYSLLALIIAGFILTGMLIPGETMFYDSTTPTLAHALAVASVGITLAAAVAFVRHKLSPTVGPGHPQQTGGA